MQASWPWASQSQDICVYWPFTNLHVGISIPQAIEREGWEDGLEHTDCASTRSTRRMFVIETASRACTITILIKRSKVRKVNHTFLPEGIQIEGPPAMPSESACSACWIKLILVNLCGLYRVMHVWGFLMVSFSWACTVSLISALPLGTRIRTLQ